MIPVVFQHGETGWILLPSKFSLSFVRGIDVSVDKDATEYISKRKDRNCCSVTWSLFTSV